MAQPTFYIAQEYDSLYILNTDVFNNITIAVSVDNNCTFFDPVMTIANIAPGTTNKVSLPLSEDGYYKLTCTWASEANGAETSTQYLEYYLSLERSMLLDMKNLLTLNPYPIDFNALYVSTVSKSNAYKGLLQEPINSSRVKTMDAIATSYLSGKCLVDDVNDAISAEKIIGFSSINNDYIRRLVALDYLTYYFMEIYAENAPINATFDDNKSFVNNKFYASEVLQAIRKLGVDIDAIQVAIQELFTISG